MNEAVSWAIAATAHDLRLTVATQNTGEFPDKLQVENPWLYASVKPGTGSFWRLQQPYPAEQAGSLRARW